jgi:hypothetical protein
MLVMVETGSARPTRPRNGALSADTFSVATKNIFLPLQESPSTPAWSEVDFFCRK